MVSALELDSVSDGVIAMVFRFVSTSLHCLSYPIVEKGTSDDCGRRGWGLINILR